MSGTFVIRPQEMDEFRSCRRAWDFEARVRQNYIPTTPTAVFNFDKAIHIALAVFYFPAMDDWNRSIVRPLAIQGFQRAMREDRTAYEEAAAVTADQDREWERYLELGDAVLNRYFDWAIPEDDFESILADEDIWVPIADPWHPGLELGTLDQQPVRFFGRIDQLISDAQDEYWIVSHRVVWEDWEDDEALLADEDALRAQWAVEVSYPQLKVAGTIYNELRVSRAESDHATSPDEGTTSRDLRDMTKGVRHLNLRRSPLTPLGKELGLPVPVLEGLVGSIEPPAAAVRPHTSPPVTGLDRIEARAGNDVVRRTHVRRAPRSIEAAGMRIAEHVLEVRDREVAVPPNPSVEKCSACAYAKPCAELNDGRDTAAVMASEYRKRSEEEFEEVGLRWSATRRAQRASLGGASLKPQNVKFRWG